MITERLCFSATRPVSGGLAAELGDGGGQVGRRQPIEGDLNWLANRGLGVWRRSKHHHRELHAPAATCQRRPSPLSTNRLSFVFVAKMLSTTRSAASMALRGTWSALEKVLKPVTDISSS